jgi:hypothetical protein
MAPLGPSFARLWLGQTISYVGSQVTQVALPLTAVVVLDASTAQMGLLRALTSTSGLATALRVVLQSPAMLYHAELGDGAGQDGVVRLTGDVERQTDRLRALTLARATDGVRSVVDEINVKVQ